MSIPTSELIRGLLATLERVSGLDSVFLARVDLVGDHFELTYTHNAATGRHPIPEGLAIPWSESVCKHALRDRVAVTHTAGERWPELAVIDDLHITTYAIAPILNNAGEVVATLCATSDRRKPVTAVARQVMKLIAELVAPHMDGSSSSTAGVDLEKATARAMHDEMTGLPSRHALLSRLAADLKHGHRCRLALVDLVGFEAIDDAHGHHGADQFLYLASQRLVAAMAGQPGAYVARSGDREFAVLVRSTHPAGAEEGCAGTGIDELRQRLVAATAGRYDIAWTTLHYGGPTVAVVASEPARTADWLLQRAEDAMQQSRRHAGRAAAPAGPATPTG